MAAAGRSRVDRLQDAREAAPRILGCLVTYSDISGLRIEDALVDTNVAQVDEGILYLDDTERVTVLRNNSLTVDGGVSFNVDAVGDFGATVKVDTKTYRVFLHISYTAASVSRPIRYDMLPAGLNGVLEPIQTPPMIIERIYLGRSLTLTFYTTDKSVTTDLHANLPAGTAVGKVDVSIKTVVNKMSLSDQFVAKGFSPDPDLTAQLRDPAKAMAAVDQLTMAMRQSNDPFVVIAYEAQPLDEIGRTHIADPNNLEPNTVILRSLQTQRRPLLADQVGLAAAFQVPLNTRRYYPDGLSVLAYENTRIAVNLVATWAPTHYDREYSVTVYINGLPQNDSIVYRKLPKLVVGQNPIVEHPFNIEVLPGRSRIEFEVHNRRLVVLFDVKFEPWDAVANKGTHIKCAQL